MKSIRFNIPDSNNLWFHYNLREDSSYAHYSNGFYFMIPIHGPENDVLKPTSSSMYTCREDAASYDIRQRLARATAHKKNWFNKARVIVLITSGQHSETEINRWMEYSLKHMHIIEKKAGWPLSKVKKLIHPDFAPSRYFYYFEGSRKWVHSPQMISFYMLLIRASRFTTMSDFSDLAKRRSINGLLNHWEGNNITSDASRMRKVLKETVRIIKNYPALFGSREMRELYLPKERTSSWLNGEGIQRMIENRTNDVKLKEAWRKCHG